MAGATNKRFQDETELDAAKDVMKQTSRIGFFRDQLLVSLGNAKGEAIMRLSPLNSLSIPYGRALRLTRMLTLFALLVATLLQRIPYAVGFLTNNFLKREYVDKSKKGKRERGREKILKL
ncbi:hypothetical protein TSAR_001617 [Trichomalopsis sarcophagae]|uniref:Uncharacterized protein n=1 Tax=Trichomalopsis sarcophagae TaxID=543379 RepID=A0A232F9J1_9HYME|nr:hypothetical protein TSAR_001617 [Trichomalopsis sarcophagae]